MKKVIIIGATSGIGRELAKLYATAGATVGITGRRQELLDSLKAEYPDRIITACFDVTGKENIHSVEALVQQLGGLDLLVYNSGFGDVSKTLDWAIDKQTVDINVNGFIEILNWAWHYFERQGSGQIANTSSVAANRGNSLAPAYSASKSFQSIYAEGLAIKARKIKLGITITDIQPGFVDTKMAKGNSRFWVAPVIKAAGQIYRAIEKKKRRAYITRRWVIIALIMRAMPFFLYRRIG
jgi:short-subunit dehydrogenase